MVEQSKRNEKRGSSRKRTQMRANIVDPDHGIIANCVVCDLSSLGAKLELKEQVDLPSTLWLKIQHDSALRYCTVKWRRGRSLGVEFSLDKLIQATEEETKKLRQLMCWQNMDRRADRDRRSGSGSDSAAEKRSGVDRRLNANKPTDVEPSSELADTDGCET